MVVHVGTPSDLAAAEQERVRRLSGALTRMINRALSAAFETWQTNAAEGTDAEDASEEVRPAPEAVRRSTAWQSTSVGAPGGGSLGDAVGGAGTAMRISSRNPGRKRTWRKAKVVGFSLQCAA